MKLKDEVCNLELAIKIKKLGVKQESLFVYYKNSLELEQNIWEILDTSSDEYAIIKKEKMISAFTVAELGIMLAIPNITFANYSLPYSTNEPCRVSYNELDYFGQKGNQIHYTMEYTEADARAKMLIYLLENKLIEIKK